MKKQFLIGLIFSLLFVGIAMAADFHPEEQNHCGHGHHEWKCCKGPYILRDCIVKPLPEPIPPYPYFGDN